MSKSAITGTHKLLRWIPEVGGQRYLQEETPIVSANDLEDKLRRLQSRPPAVVHLKAPNDNKLVIGIAGQRGTLMFQRANLDPPYLCTVRKPSAGEADVEFDVEGTPTPVESKNVVSFEEVLGIAKFFLEHSELPPGREWDEA